MTEEHEALILQERFSDRHDWSDCFWPGEVPGDLIEAGRLLRGIRNGIRKHWPDARFRVVIRTTREKVVDI